MKKLLTLIAMFVCTAASCPLGAQTPSTARTQVFTTDIRCENCKKKIMDNVITFGRGVKDVTVDVTRKEVAVTYDPLKNSPQHLVAAFKKLGITASPKDSTATCAERTCAAQAVADSSCCTAKKQNTCESRQKKADCCTGKQQGSCASRQKKAGCCRASGETKQAACSTSKRPKCERARTCPQQQGTEKKDADKDAAPVCNPQGGSC